MIGKPARGVQAQKEILRSDGSQQDDRKVQACSELDAVVRLLEIARIRDVAVHGALSGGRMRNVSRGGV